MLHVLLAIVVETSPSLQYLVFQGIIPFKEIPHVQSVKLDKPVLILRNHLNTVLVAPTVKRLVYVFIVIVFLIVTLI